MRYILSTLVTVMILFSWGSCGEVPTTEPEAIIDETDFSDLPVCLPARTYLEGNLRNFVNARKTVVISPMEVENGEEQHRIFEVFRSHNCELLDSIMLPPAAEPDIPYLLANINYNNYSQLVGIRAVDKIYCYNLDQLELMDPLIPKYNSERSRVDAQSGVIQHLEVWERYLVGYAQDCGTFVFDFQDPHAPKPVLPIAEYKIDDGSYSQLFILPSVPVGSSQLLLPKMTEKGLLVNPLLKNPRPLREQIVQSAADNPYIIIRDQQGKAIAVDMPSQSRSDIPEDMEDADNEALLDYMRGQ